MNSIEQLIQRKLGIALDEEKRRIAKTLILPEAMTLTTNAGAKPAKPVPPGGAPTGAPKPAATAGSGTPNPQAAEAKKQKNQAQADQLKQKASAMQKQAQAVQAEPVNEDFSSIGHGDHVTIKTPQGQTQKGKAVMRGPHGWVLNLGGKHGTPGIASEKNYLSHRKAATKKKVTESEDSFPLMKKSVPAFQKSTPKTYPERKPPTAVAHEWKDRLPKYGFKKVADHGGFDHYEHKSNPNEKIKLSQTNQDYKHTNGKDVRGQSGPNQHSFDVHMFDEFE